MHNVCINENTDIDHANEIHVSFVGCRLVVDSPHNPCSKKFSLGSQVFPSPQNPTFPNSNSTRNQIAEEPICGCATSKSSFILFYNYLEIVTTDPHLHAVTHLSFIFIMYTC